MSECKRCGWCCDHFKVLVVDHKKQFEQAKWLEHHGCEVKELPARHEILHVNVSRRCNQLRFKVKEKIKEAYCKIYDDRPEMCKIAGCPKEGIEIKPSMNI